MNQENFDNIRSVEDDEVKDAILKLTENQYFVKLLSHIYQGQNINDVIAKLLKIETIREFQEQTIEALLNDIIHDTISKLTYSGLENIQADKSYLYISSHRDIILDSVLMNKILHENGFETSEVAIGGNLLIYPWIETLVRLNRSFIVQRGLHGKEMLLASKQLSSYIRKKLIRDKKSVWIAQREGRTKDGNDKTQIALLKMINMSGTGRIDENFKELNIIPLSVSYEYETCIIHKVESVYAKRHNIKHEKTEEEDLKSMTNGLFGQKGKVHVHFGKQLDDFDGITDISNTNQKFELIAKQIDTEIYKNFKLTANNYMAHDLFYQSSEYFAQGKYTKKQLDKFLENAQSKIANIKGNQDELKSIFFEIYATPIDNKIKYITNN